MDIRQFANLSIPWPLKPTESDIANLPDTICSLINDGYTQFCLDTQVVSPISQAHTCVPLELDLEKAWKEFESKQMPAQKSLTVDNIKGVRVMRRLSVELNNPKAIHHMINTNVGSSNVKSQKILHSYDILAAVTETESLFRQIVEKGDIDIIQLNLMTRMKWFLDKKLINQAIEKQIQFEVVYSPCLEDPTKRKQFLVNFFNLVKVTKGKNIILSGGTTEELLLRTPTDLVAIGKSVGMSKEQALDAVSKNCDMVKKHSAVRKSYKGAVQLHDSENEEEEYKQKKGSLLDRGLEREAEESKE